MNSRLGRAVLHCATEMPAATDEAVSMGVRERQTASNAPLIRLANHARMPYRMAILSRPGAAACQFPCPAHLCSPPCRELPGRCLPAREEDELHHQRAHRGAKWCVWAAYFRVAGMCRATSIPDSA